MKNRTNLICAVVWAMAGGMWLGSHSYLQAGLNLLVAALYGSKVWKLAQAADKAAKEAEVTA